MRSVFAVIRREYLQRVRTLAFLISTLAIPVLLILAIAVPAFVATREPAERLILVVDETGELAELVVERLEGAGYVTEVVSSPSPEMSALEARVRAEDDLSGALFLGEATLTSGMATFSMEGSLSMLRRIAISQAVQQSALEVRLAETGGEVGALLSGGELDVRRLDVQEGGSEGDDAMLFAFIGTFLLFGVIITYAAAVLRAVMEEKNGKIVEIIVSSMRPSQLMLGKILGVGAAGLTQLGIWVAAGALIFAAGLPVLIAMLPEGIGLDEASTMLPSAGLIALWTAFFLLGYFLYASMYAAIGAICSSEQEVQQVQFPVIALLMIPFFFTQTVIENPDTTLATGLSLVPFFTPLLMFSRVAAGVVPAWQVALSLVLMVLAIGGVAWVAGRIYRVGILMQGKRPTVPELWRWVR